VWDRGGSQWIGRYASRVKTQRAVIVGVFGVVSLVTSVAAGLGLGLMFCCSTFEASSVVAAGEKGTSTRRDGDR
jgi:hypothetical protein